LINPKGKPMNFQDYIRYDAVGLAELIRKKEVSADEVLRAALSRLDEVNPKLNLLAHDLRERAAAWQGSSENADTPLAGVPFLLKDLLADWEGAPTWSGSRMMQHYIAKQNSDLTQAYLDAGLRVFGKTTTPEWGAYPVTETEIYGITRNPWHLDYTAGGSSGGAAAGMLTSRPVVPSASEAATSAPAVRPRRPVDDFLSILRFPPDNPVNLAIRPGKVPDGLCRRYPVPAQYQPGTFPNPCRPRNTPARRPEPESYQPAAPDALQ